MIDDYTRLPVPDDELLLRSCLLAVATRGVRWLAAKGFSRWFAPWSIGAARPFFTPKWVASFEKAHAGRGGRSSFEHVALALPGWSYEDALMRGKGAVYFLAGTGAFLNQQFQGWSSEARGGKMEFHKNKGVYRFTPDASAYGYLRRLVPVKAPQLILPTPAPVRQLILPGGGAA